MGITLGGFLGASSFDAYNHGDAEQPAQVIIPNGDKACPNPSQKSQTASEVLVESPSAQPAVEMAVIDVRPYHHAAAGLGAIASTLKHTFHEMGVVPKAPRPSSR